MKSKKAKYEWLFFDVGSTLIDEEAAQNERIRTMLEFSGVSAEEFNQKRIEFAKTGANADKRAIEYYGLTKTRWPNELERPYPDAKRTLVELKRRGYKLGIIANQKRGLSLRLLKWGLLGCFKVIASSSALGIAKPNEGIFRYALKKARCSPENAVMIGDRLDNDIAPAKKLGMHTVWVRKGLSVHREPKNEAETPNSVVDGLEEMLLLFR